MGATIPESGPGQLYNREYLEDVLFLIPGAVLIWLVGRATPTDLLALAQPSATLILLLATLLAMWIWAIIDAWKVAARWQAAEGVNGRVEDWRGTRERARLQPPPPLLRGLWLLPRRTCLPLYAPAFAGRTRSRTLIGARRARR